LHDIFGNPAFPAGVAQRAFYHLTFQVE
jgi:hypothetical protein